MTVTTGTPFQSSAQFSLSKKIPPRERSRLFREAEEQAIGTEGENQSSLQELLWSKKEASSEVAQFVDEVALAAFYIPTGESFDLTSRMLLLQWTEAQGQAASEGTLQLANGDGQASQKLNMPGMILFVSTAGPTGVFHEHERFFVSESTATDLSQGLINQQISDNLAFLHNVEQSFSYTPDSRHRGGWEAGQIASDICKKLGVPVGSIVKTNYKIKYFVAREISAYDAIVKAYTIDYYHSGKFFYVTTKQGKLVVRRPRKRNTIIALDIDNNVFNAQFTRKLPEKFYSAIVPQGGTPNAQGKRVSNAKVKARPTAGPKGQAASRATGSSRAKAGSPLVSSVLFGDVTYKLSGDRLGTVKDSTWTRARAALLADELARVIKSLEVTAPLNAFIKQGDRVYCRMRFASGHIFRKELFVTSASKTVSPQGNLMTLACAWRQFETVPFEETENVQRAPEGGPQAPTPEGAIKLEKGGKGKIVTASVFGGPGDPKTGATGYRGDNLNQHPDSFAELSTNPSAPTSQLNFSALGGLPYLQAVRVTYGGNSVILKKRDVGGGGPGISGHPRTIDIWYQAAATLGLTGLGLVEVEFVH